MNLDEVQRGTGTVGGGGGGGGGGSCVGLCSNTTLGGKIVKNGGHRCYIDMDQASVAMLEAVEFCC